jgi:hypothetical protein
MKKRSFLTGTLSLPVLFHTLGGHRCVAEPQPTAKNEGATLDVFEGDFPPVCYGRTLDEVEGTIQQIVERVFRDEDGMILSAVNGKTMKPFTPADIQDRPDGLGAPTRHSAMPESLKTAWTNYENAGEAAGSYLDALCLKAAVTGDPKVRELAQRTVNAIVALWNNAAAPFGLGGGGRGWFPKPYGGIRKVVGIEECSADQYADVTHGLHTYYLLLADEAEKKQIEEIVVSFADWWFDHDYSGVYFGKPIWWKRLEWHSMATSYFLYLNALAESWRPGRKSKEGFAIWLGLRAHLLRSLADKASWITMHGITLKCLERLIALRPDLNGVWQPAVAQQVQWLTQSIEPKEGWKAFSVKAYAASYLSTAHSLVPDAGYDRQSLALLEACTQRADFYHIRRGAEIASLSAVQRGDDYRNMFWCENHTHWMIAYWSRRWPISSEK